MLERTGCKFLNYPVYQNNCYNSAVIKVRLIDFKILLLFDLSSNNLQLSFAFYKKSHL